MKKKTTLGLLQEVCNNEYRKGIHKLKYQHFLDVLEQCTLQFVSDKRRAATLFRVALLHDILEDTDLSDDELRGLIDINEKELRLIRKLSRNRNSPDEYLQNIIDDEDAFIVKLADRISNMKDLLLWIENEGITERNQKLASKYLEENKTLFTGLQQKKYIDYLSLDSKEAHPFFNQFHRLNKLQNKLLDLVV